MNELNSEGDVPTTESVIAPLCKVTPLSKYLALVIFIALPFAGGYVGWLLHTETPQISVNGTSTRNEAVIAPEIQSYTIDPYKVTFDYPVGWHRQELSTSTEPGLADKSNLLQAVTVAKGDFDFVRFEILKNTSVNLGYCNNYHAIFIDGVSSYWEREGDIVEERCLPGAQALSDFKRIGTLQGHYVIEQLSPRPISIALNEDHVLQIYISSSEYDIVMHPELVFADMPQDFQIILNSLRYGTQCEGDWCRASTTDESGSFILEYPKTLELDGRGLESGLQAWTAWEQGYILPTRAENYHSGSILTKDRSTIFHMVARDDKKLDLHKISLIDKTDVVLQSYQSDDLDNWITGNWYGPIWPRYVGSSSILMYYKVVSSEEKWHTVLVSKSGLTKELPCGVAPYHIAVSPNEAQIIWSCPDIMTISDWVNDTKIAAQRSHFKFINDRVHFINVSEQQSITTDNACATAPTYSMNYSGEDVRNEKIVTNITNCSGWGEW
jgi:hypothetical protein